LLAVTLRLLQEHGYDRLSVDAVATEAKASKATVYRRWPSKAELALEAFIEGVHVVAVPPCTGSLRGDLLQIGAGLCKQARLHAKTLRAVLAEFSRNPALSAAFREEFVHRPRLLMMAALSDAADRGEIDAAVISEELGDVLPGYLFFRSVMPGRLPTNKTVRVLVDEVLMPGLTTRIRPRTS
jgi:AcrR family transcriptional regulator